MAKLPSCEDYEISINVPRLVKSSKLSCGHVEKNAIGTTINYVGGFCIVFPYIKSNGEKIAVRCWIASVENAQERTRRIAEKLKEIKLPYFVNFEYEPNGVATNFGVQPIVLMDWVNAQSLKEYIKSHLKESDVIRSLADAFMQMAKELHAAGVSHGDLQHGNIMVNADGSLILVDYDSMYVPSLEGYADEIKGLVGYQHPARWENCKCSPKADYFSELVIYTSLIALAVFPELWEELKIEDSETLIFSANDISSGGASAIFQKLDSNPELKVLSEAIKRALSFKSIDELKPLEEAIVPATVALSNDIRKKWKLQKNVAQEEFCPDTSNTRAKWNKPV